MNQSGARFLLTLSICLAWALTSIAPIWKYLAHTQAAAAIVLGLFSIALGMYWLDRLNRKQQQISNACSYSSFSVSQPHSPFSTPSP